jgi:hypothetical protein
MQTRLSLLWLIVTAVVYAFYSGEKPEYYYLLAVPALMVISIKVLSKLPAQIVTVFILIFCVNATWLNLRLHSTSAGLSVGNIEQVYEHLNTVPVKEVVYDIPNGSEIGMKYFLSDIEVDSTGDTYHISYPHSLNFAGITHISDIAVWKEVRTGDKNYLLTNDYLLASSKDVLLLVNEYPSADVQAVTTYQVVRNNQVIGTLQVAPERNNKIEWVQECIVNKENMQMSWQSRLSDTSRIMPTSHHCLRFVSEDVRLEHLDQLGLEFH